MEEPAMTTTETVALAVQLMVKAAVPALPSGKP